jgi:hypothetical protein
MENKSELIFSIILILVGLLMMQPTSNKNTKELYEITNEKSEISSRRIVERINPSYDKIYPKKN